MSIQGYIERNAQATFSQHLNKETAEYFTGLKQSTLKVTANLNDRDQEWVKSVFPVPIQFVAPKKPTLQPHPAMDAVRDGFRVIYTGLKQRTDNLKTLHIGACNREISNGRTKPNYHFSIHGQEPKDDNRVYVSILDKVNALLHKVQQTHPGFNDVSVSMERLELIELYCLSQGMGPRIGIDLERSGEQYSRLLYEDSAYNKGMQGIYEDMKCTGANYALLYMVLPPELIDPGCPINEQYKVEIGAGGRARMTDVRGFANGYEHDAATWADLLKAPAYGGKEFNVVFEIVARAGPFCIIEATRTHNGGKVVRDLTVLQEPYVKVVDISSFGKRAETFADVIMGKKIDLRDYFLVKKSEFDSVKTYVSSIATKSMDIEVVTSFIRKRSGGAALIDRVYTKPWTLAGDHYTMLAAATIAIVLFERGVFTSALNQVNKEGLMTQIGRSFLAELLPTWFVRLIETRGKDIAPYLATLHDPVLNQDVQLETRQGFQMFLLESVKTYDTIEPEEVKKCSVCKRFPTYSPDDKSNIQTMMCGKDSQMVTYGMSQEALDEFLVELTPDDDDAPGLIRVKENAKKAMPRTEFTNTVETITIVGAFGTGKSHLIKNSIGMDDVVIAPFKKLLADYTVDSGGNKIHFKTNHRGISDYRKADIMYVDECGSLPAEYVVAMVHLYQPNLVIMVGDMKQTKTLKSEGTPIDEIVDFKNSHYLLKNFRNPRQVIDWAVKNYGYHMEPAGDKFNSSAPMITIRKPTWKSDKVVVISPDRASVDKKESSATVRQYQGQTVDELTIRITPAGLQTFASPCIKLVGLTRSRGTTNIVLANGASQQVFLDLLKVKEYTAYKARKINELNVPQVNLFAVALTKMMTKKTQEQFLESVGINNAEEMLSKKELKKRRQQIARKKAIAQPAHVESSQPVSRCQPAVMVTANKSKTKAIDKKVKAKVIRAQAEAAKVEVKRPIDLKTTKGKNAVRVSIAQGKSSLYPEFRTQPSEAKDKILMGLLIDKIPLPSHVVQYMDLRKKAGVDFSVPDVEEEI